MDAGNSCLTRKAIAEPVFAGNGVVADRLAETRCPRCGVQEMRLPAYLDSAAAHALDRIFGAPRRLARRESAFRAGAEFLAVHAVRVGTLKTVIVAQDGREQITGYHMAGDIIGLTDLGRSVHRSDAVALEDSEICSLPFDRMLDLARREPKLVPALFALMARDLRRNQELILLLGSMNAEERLAVFLLDLSSRHRERGYSGNEFLLRMTREEIASFLGLKLETVSRVFSRLHGEGLIQVQGRAVKLLDPEALRRLAGYDCGHTEPSGIRD